MSLALIIRKPTNLEQHQLLQEQRLVGATDPLYLAEATRAHDEHYACLETLRKCLRSLGMEYKEASRDQDEAHGNFDVVITLGGDGTLIKGSYGIHDRTPLIGIRSSSASVGFLCAGDASSVEEIMQKFAQGTLEIDERCRLQAIIQRVDGRIEKIETLALNDFLFAAASPAATSRYRLSFLDRIEAHRSSGIWISTATGSTAGTGAAGGTPMAANDPHFQFKVRELYHKREEDLLLTHGFVAADQDVFWIENHCPAAILALDGEKQVVKINFGDMIRFAKAQPVRVARRLHS